MPKVLVTESNLENIADAIREKNGQSTEYLPSEMAAAVRAIETGITPTGTKNITVNGTHDVTEYASAEVNVPNSYAAGDEGKVVSNGELVAQISRTITENGTYDTTLVNELIANISGGGSESKVLINELQTQHGGSFTFNRTITIEENGNYKISAQSFSNAPSLTINGVSQSVTFSQTNYYVYVYNIETTLSAGDEIEYMVNSSGDSMAYISVVKS